MKKLDMHYENKETHFFISNVFQSVWYNSNAHVHKITASNFKNFLAELLAVFVNFLNVSNYIEIPGFKLIFFLNKNKMFITSTVMLPIIARWWPSRVTRAMLWISSSDFPKNCSHAVDSISSFWPWILTYIILKIVYLLFTTCYTTELNWKVQDYYIIKQVFINQTITLPVQYQLLILVHPEMYIQ